MRRQAAPVSDEGREKGLGPLGVLRQLPFGITGTINTRIPPLQIGYLGMNPGTQVY